MLRNCHESETVKIAISVIDAHHLLFHEPKRPKSGMIPLPRIFCIRLRSSTSRWAEASSHFKSIEMDVEPFDGFDGSLSGLKASIPYEIDQPKSGYLISSKHVGMHLSHYMLWSALYMSRVSSAIILEDDAVFESGWRSVFDSESSNVPEDWDVVYIGNCCVSGRPQRHISGRVYEVKYPLCTHAYMVNNKALPVLLENMQKVWAPIDLALMFDALPKLRVYTILPSLASQRNTNLNP